VTAEEVQIIAATITKAIKARVEARFAAFGPDLADAQARAVAAEARCGALEIRCRELGDRVLQRSSRRRSRRGRPRHDPRRG
jgi:hypothetical protein